MNRFEWNNNYEDIINGKIKVEYSSSLRKLILKNELFPYKCNHCGIKEWNNKPITLEIEHKDGIKTNNCKNNLELLCPNCHSQTSTFRKNRTNLEQIYLDQNMIIKEFYNSNSIGDLLNNLNLNKNESNYKKVRKILNNKELKFIKKIKLNSNLKKTDYSDLKLLIINSNIDFNKKTWGVEVSKLLNKSPQYCLKLIKENFPEFIIPRGVNKTNQDIINERVLTFNNSNLDINSDDFFIKLGELYNISKWAANRFFLKYLK